MKKIIALLLAAVMVLGLAACGSSTTETPSTTAATPEVQETVATEAAAEGTSTIVYWAQWSENEAQALVLKDAIARFEANNPEYTVEVNWAGRDVRDIMRTSIDSGIQIDIIESGYDRILSQLGEDYLVDLTEYVAGTEFEASISEGMASFAKGFTSTGESWYYIPAQPFVGTIFYNKAIFREAGIEKLPETWSEFMDCCQKILDAGYAPITSDDAYLECLYTAYLGTMLGMDTVDEMVNNLSAELWSSDAVAQMAKDFAEMASKGYFTEGTGSYVFPSAQNTEFAMGTTAMYYNGSWLPNEVASITGDEFEWGAMYFPVPDGATGAYTTYTTGCQFYAVPKTAKNVEGAVKLLAEFTSVETQTDLLNECQCIPVIDGLELPAALADCGTLMSTATNAVPWCYSSSISAEVRAVLTPSFSKLLAGEITADAFVEEVVSQMQ